MKLTSRELGVLKVLTDLGVGHSYLHPGIDQDEEAGRFVTIRPLELEVLDHLVKRKFVANIAGSYSITKRGMQAIGREKLGPV